MLVILVCLTLIFVFAAFLGQSSVTLVNPFLGYIFFQLSLVLNHIVLSLIGFSGILFFFFREHHVRKRSSLYTHLSQAFGRTCVVVASCLLFAFASLICIAFLQINSYSLIISLNPSLLGITTDTARIAKTLKNNAVHPTIVASDNSSQPRVAALAQATVASGTLYNKTILPAIPSYLVLPVGKHDVDFMLIDNTLIVSKVEKSDLETIGPLLGYLFVQDYFQNRQIKSFPTVSLMNTKEYQSFRKEDAKTKAAKVTTEVEKMTTAVSSLSAQITKDTDALTQNQSEQQRSLKEQSTQYNQCLSTGTYSSGKFVPKYTKDYCQRFLTLWDGTLTAQQQEESQLKLQRQKDQQLLKEYQYYVSFFKAQKSLLTLAGTNIPSELGIFEQPRSIRILMQETSPHRIGDFLETLCHEYLHYASYVPGKRLDSSFFEEALTEYFARKVVKDSLQIDTDLGYPAGVEIITALTQRIPEVDLADIYFSKDQAGLEKELDLTYGDNFYANNITLFESLQYTSDPKETLRLANTIMKKIGGKQLHESDIFSKESNL